MIQFKTIIDIIGADCEDQLPAILSGLGLSDFQEYVSGPPRDEKKVSLAYMFDPDVTIDPELNSVPVLFYAQLPGINYDDTLLYLSAITEFVENYDPNSFGFPVIFSISIDIIPPDRLGSALLYVSVVYNNPQDSCDS